MTKMTLHGVLLAALALGALAGAGCRTIGVALAPDRVPEPPGDSTAAGERLFSEAIAAGAYARLPEVIETLTRLAIAHPRDGRLHTLLGMTHLWAVSEKDRAERPSPRLTEHVVLSRHYLASARALLPNDPRIRGWSAGSHIAAATLLDDQRARREAYFDMKDAASAFPEFNLFSASFVFSRLPADDPKYDAEVVEPMFEAFERCYGAASDWAARRRALSAAMGRPAPAGPGRVCHPSPQAPHNIEGFFMHFGDALAKAGRVEDARQAWQLASAAPGYAGWPYRTTLESRIADAPAFAARARAGKRGEGMMITSSVASSGCHQE